MTFRILVAFLTLVGLIVANGPDYSPAAKAGESAITVAEWQTLNEE